MNITKTGIACQKWDIQAPQSHDRPPDVFPEVQNAENYCRNAGGEESMPWCYTMDPVVRWQHCDIPVCGKFMGINFHIIYIISANNKKTTLKHMSVVVP